MATQDVTRLLSDVQSNKSLQESFEGVTGADEISRKAAEVGYEFTADEFRTASSEFYESHGMELTDEQLEAVAGGVCCSSIIIIIN